MNYWLRLYTGILDDPKVQRLAPEYFKGWVNLLCLAKEHDGLLPSTEDIAFRLRITEADAERLVEELVKRGLLDTTEGGLFEPHNWDNRQFLSDDDPTAAIRARRYRANKTVTRDATDGVTDASRPSETEYRDRAETETEAEQSRGGSGENPSPVASRPKRAAARRPTTCDEEFLEELQNTPAYSVFDVKTLYGKMVVWCQMKGKQPTRARLVNWLNREDRPMTSPGNGKLASFTPNAQQTIVALETFVKRNMEKPQ